MTKHSAFSISRPGCAVRPLRTRSRHGLLSPYGSLGLARSDILMVDSLSLASESSADTLPIGVGQEVGADFSPVLNVPAFSSFLVVAAIFLFLQVRISMIGRAADQRTEALEELRSVKKLELVGRTTPDEVQRALNKYRETYDRVEELRTIVPGARIAPPPSQSLSRERMEDNVKGARQFLSIDPEPSEEKDDKTDKKLALPLVLLLAAVAASQIGLLVLLSVDPVTGKGIFDVIGSIPGFPSS